MIQDWASTTHSDGSLDLDRRADDRMADVIAFAPHQPELYRLRESLESNGITPKPRDEETLQADESFPQSTARRGGVSKLHYIRSWLPHTRLTICLTVIVGIQGVVAITLGVLINRVYSQGLMRLKVESGSTFAVEFLSLGQLCTTTIESTYLLMLCLDATWTRNVVEAIGVCLNSLSILFTAAIGMWTVLYSESFMIHFTAEDAYHDAQTQLLKQLYIALLSVVAIGTLSA